MKISKHLHSCLLLEEQGKTIIIDPGIFTYQEKALNVSKLEKLYYLLITHEHPDHGYLPFIKELVKRFPKTKIITTTSFTKTLAKENITASSKADDIVSVEKVPHEKLWDKEVPENVMVTVFGKLASPGDSHHFETNAEIIALPIVAPWGATTDAVTLALELKPKVIIPIHDWMYRDGIRQTMYQRLKEFFQTKGIDFKMVETGDILEV
jgi:L-ascorbate metabolism protein UlaG (beta-lactamase superfamily)